VSHLRVLSRRSQQCISPSAMRMPLWTPYGALVRVIPIALLGNGTRTCTGTVVYATGASQVLHRDVLKPDSARPFATKKRSPSWTWHRGGHAHPGRDRYGTWLAISMLLPSLPSVSCRTLITRIISRYLYARSLCRMLPRIRSRPMIILMGSRFVQSESCLPRHVCCAAGLGVTPS
jgi:hypothetical protein